MQGDVDFSMRLLMHSAYAPPRPRTLCCYYGRLLWLVSAESWDRPATRWGSSCRTISRPSSVTVRAVSVARYASAASAARARVPSSISLPAYYCMSPDRSLNPALVKSNPSLLLPRTGSLHLVGNDLRSLLLKIADTRFAVPFTAFRRLLLFSAPLGCLLPGATSRRLLLFPAASSCLLAVVCCCVLLQC